jgi:bis(5'-nucleosyl)-tetraphosphatase (symmetrical)
MATYAIGDIQGCFDALRRLLDLCAFDRTKDKLWLVGDLVNRGPKSLKTLRLIKSLGPAAQTVLGNHDLYLLMVAEGGAKYRGKDDTIQGILDAKDRTELLDWLRHQPLCHTEGKYCMVHAGLLPQWTANRARELSREVEAALQGPDYHEFILNLWGSEPAGWSDDLSGWQRPTRHRQRDDPHALLHTGWHHGIQDQGRIAQRACRPSPWFEAPNRTKC